jgi:hypothetical protein
MPTLYIVIGLLGSGKSYYLKNLIKKGNADHTCVYDDYYANAYNNSSLTKDSKYFKALIDNLKGERNCVAVDIAFCIEERLTEFSRTIMEIVNIVTIIKVYFDNNPYSCKENVKYDSDKSVEDRLEKIDELTNACNIPAAVSTIKVKVWNKVQKPRK